ncbi:GDSL-type esterase/lipase family protein [Sporosarcina sp. FSL K6-3457]|uniref:GDSL-type esterase/lipase family protein n=1 Tax=Sporosarcina sp. FSL K6-3457 TaxID=2978204 RepID=UPI0030FCCAC4
MQKSIMKFRILFALALVFQLIALPISSFAQQAEATTPIEYLSLGDSLAYGQDSNDDYGKGYPDFLAEILEEANLLKSYNNDFSFPGFTTDDVLNGLKEKAELRELVKSADFITLSAGANDLFAYFKLDKSTGKIDYNLVELLGAVQQVRVNYHSILQEIYTINPKAQVYIMGGYNPFPYITDPTLKPLVGQLVGQLNGAIQQGITGTTAVFVPTAEIIDENFTHYLPNPSNVHLSEAGYQRVAEQFNSYLQDNYPWTSEIKYKEIPKEGTFSSDKYWTISLSKAVDITTIEPTTIYVHDAEANVVPAILEGEGQKIIVRAPESGYAPGTYTLYVTTGLKDHQNNNLKEPVKMTFEIE